MSELRKAIEQMGVKIVSDEEAEGAGAVLCLRIGDYTPFIDNVETNCAFCGTAIFHRPSAPVKPPKVCMPCVVDRAPAGGAH
jgi:hypothetical protein